jgi:hypothetical protein
LIVDLAVVIATFLAREDFHCFVFRADCGETSLRFVQRNLLVPFAVEHQEGARDSLHDTVKFEWRKPPEHVVL